MTQLFVCLVVVGFLFLDVVCSVVCNYLQFGSQTQNYHLFYTSLSINDTKTVYLLVFQRDPTKNQGRKLSPFMWPSNYKYKFSLRSSGAASGGVCGGDANTGGAALSGGHSSPPLSGSPFYTKKRFKPKNPKTDRQVMKSKKKLQKFSILIMSLHQIVPKA